MYFIYFGKTAVYFYLNLNIETKYQLITIIYLIKIINYDIIAKKKQRIVYMKALDVLIKVSSLVLIISKIIHIRLEKRVSNLEKSPKRSVKFK
ncbi:hypothetical protein CFT12S02225_06270 [Campylobacter fetus subsp. testudinum]|uniref:Uncharacterized protein n=1 Tax=Campylobacter fetus subsp. testudinum TaxID=1507806 RepID=A0AAX0HB93_CAMFE|nr:hypothetical protein CFT12S02225_06270 [Campylobacter fetus subsp. testudinum]